MRIDSGMPYRWFGFRREKKPKRSCYQPAADGSSDIIRIENLSKTFFGKQTVQAVDDVSFSVRRGEIFGLLGPNGAGKSTLIRILTTLLRPSSGVAYLNDYELTCDAEQIRAIIGVCPQNSTLDVELTAYENLEFYGNLTGVDADLLPERIRTLLEMTGLAGRADARVNTFSGGMKRKLEIVRAFIHRPLILFLDEPTIGLDPESRHEVWREITELNTEDTTIILTTHYMDEAEKLCERIAFMDQGRLIRLDTPENLKRSLSLGDRIEITVEHASPDLIAEIQAVCSHGTVEHTGNAILIDTMNGSRLLPSLFKIFEERGDAILSLSIRSPSLEDVFLSLTGRNLDPRRSG